MECFGDTGLIEAEGRQLALLETTRPIKLLDLQGNGAMRAGTVVAISGAADRQLSQKWSRYFYGCYQEIHGLIYTDHTPLAEGGAKALSSPVHLRAPRIIVVPRDIHRHEKAAHRGGSVKELISNLV